jgi:hypothetical protein
MENMETNNEEDKRKSMAINILKEAEALLQKLAKPLQEEEIKNGWTEKTQIKTIDILTEFKNELSAGKKSPDINLIRGLDYSGVLEGKLMKGCASFAIMVKHYQEKFEKSKE